MLPFSEACERNKQPILAVLSRHLAGSPRVLEVGAGTGQHAVHFARHLERATWQPTERAEYLPGLAARIAQQGTANLSAPLALDVADAAGWPEPGRFDALYSANTLHIMSWSHVQAMFAGIARLFADVPSAQLFLYGPFKYGGRFTTQSNADFDVMLRERDPVSGLRDFERVAELAAGAGFDLLEDCALPANNQLLVWRRSPTS